VHSGHSLPVKAVARLQADLKIALQLDKEDAVFHRFLKKLGDLVDASLPMGKPLGVWECGLLRPAGAPDLDDTNTFQDPECEHATGGSHRARHLHPARDSRDGAE